MQQYFVEQAETYDEACLKVKEKYGDRAAISLRKTIQLRGGLFGMLFPKEGVEVTGLVPPSFGNQGTGRQFFNSGEYAYSGLKLPPQYANSVQGIMGENGKNTGDFETEKRKVLAAAGKPDTTILQVLNEVRDIKEKLDSQALAPLMDTHPCFQRLEEILTLNDFSPSYREHIFSRIKKEFSLDSLDDFDAVQDKVLEWIGESILVSREDGFHTIPRVIVIVGPTGVGKTTTIAKLAANFGIDNIGRKIRQLVLITIDAFRIGAKQQLEAYGNILEFPCFAVEDFDELKRTIAVNSDGTDIILIDTIGKSPRDMVKLGEMKQLLDACGSLAEVHLAVTAATKYSDMSEILRQFEPFNYRSVIVTKLDETLRTGNIISVLAEKGKSVSYITNGQRVPADIQKATVMHFLTNLEGFKVNRIALEEKFSGDDSDKLQRWNS
ncbi:MAG: flagellar biosynthesis protein FlhF [Treponema sp.]|jgi:flagellar biosynthesis protein FlhF|nr:flagellar biosynthesis protein FlhF [Treponema sp.]